MKKRVIDDLLVLSSLQGCKIIKFDKTITLYCVDDEGHVEEGFQ